MAVTKRIRVQRPKRPPVLLERAARQRGLGLVETLADALRRHATDIDAAADLGVSRETIRSWKRRYANELEIVR